MMSRAERSAANKRRWRLLKDYGYVFSHRMRSQLVARTGRSPAEVDQIIDTLSDIIREELLNGHPVGFNRGPVMFMRRRSAVVYSILRGVQETKNGVPRLFVRTPKPFRVEADETLIDRGDLRTQFESARLVAGYKSRSGPSTAAQKSKAV